jgi:hypothetical protein
VVGQLGGGHVGDELMLMQLGQVANSIYVEDVDGGPPGRRCQEPGAPTTHVKDVEGAPWEAMLGTGSAYHLC